MSRASRVSWLLLGLIAALAAAGRFTALGWGLRHLPEVEERLFVENLRRMLAAGDLDHRFYEYPALFFYLMAPAVALVEPAGGSSHPASDDVAGAAAYLAARGVVAAFGVASVVLVFLLGRRLMDERAGLVAAALLAVSPFEIETAHTVRPDVVLETFVLLALLAFLRVGDRPRDDVIAGLALGAAAAVKFTGGLLVPVYLLARWLTPGARVKGTLVAGTTALFLWLLLTPYAVLKPQAFLSGTADQWNYHYRSGEVAGRFFEILRYYLAAHVRGLGPIAAGLAGLGLLWALAGPSRRREWLPVAAWPITMLGVLCTADMRYGRLSLSISCVAALLAARVLVRVTEARAAWTAVATALVLVVPARASFLYLRDLASPIPSDVVADWVHTHVPDRATILCRLEWLGIDRRRYEVLRSDGFPDQDRLLATQADYVIDGERDPRFAELRPAFITDRISTFNGDRLAVRPVPSSLRRNDTELSLQGARVTVSSNGEEAAAVLDGRLDAAWSTAHAQSPGDWLQIDLPARVAVGRVELMTGGKPHRAAQELRLWAGDDAGGWHRVSFVPARPPVEQQPNKGRSQVLLFEPVRTGALRIEQIGRGRTRWSVAEIRLGAPEPGLKADPRTGEPGSGGR